MPGIFLSYRRRGESAGYAGHLADELGTRFGQDQLFRDIDTIPPGQDFVKVIAEGVGSCDVLLAVIGPDWLTATDAAGRRRLDDPDDFIRHEIAAALARDIPVIPVLVAGAAMPSGGDLPEPLKPLARRQASEISDARWEFDVQQLIAAIKRAGVRTVGQQGPAVERRWLKRAAIAVVVVAALWAGWRFLLARRTPVVAPQIDVFEAMPPRVRAGESVVLRWRTSNAEQVTLQGHNVWPSDTVEVDPAKSTTFRLVARTRSAQVERAVTVDVAAPPLAGRPAIVSFQAEPSAINPGETAMLHWHTTNAQSVTLNGKPVPLAEAEPVTPTATTTYELVAANERGDRDSRSVTVQVTAVPVKPHVELRAFPATVTREQPARLCWVIVNASSARIDPDVGPLAAGQLKAQKDCVTVTPLKTTTYTLTAVGERGATQADTATVQVRAGKPRVVGPVVGGIVASPSAPIQLAPPDGAQFDRYPRTTTLSWRSVPNAVTYVAEIDCLGCCGAGWCADAGRTWQVCRAKATSCTFAFVGAQPGRWRVWGVDTRGNETAKSGWWQFRYTR